MIILIMEIRQSGVKRNRMVHFCLVVRVMVNKWWFYKYTSTAAGAVQYWIHTGGWIGAPAVLGMKLRTLQ
jgi:hypothetical protein